MRSLFVLFKTELKLSVREFSGVLFGILLPVGLMLLLGALNGNSPAYEGAGFTATQVSFAAVVTIGIIATGLMGMPLSVCNYREKKVLKRFKVTPTSPMKLLGAQGLTQFIFAVFSSLLVWIVAVLFFDYTMPGNGWLFILAYLFVLAVTYAIGILIASVSRTIKTANLLTSLVYFPIFFLSGATVPYEIMPRGVQIVSDIMPLTHGIKLLKAVSLNLPLENGIISIGYLAITLVVCCIVSVKTFRWE